LKALRPDPSGRHPLKVLGIELSLDDAEELGSLRYGRGRCSQRDAENAQNDCETGH
jgi:hypothetical protein